MKISLRGPLMAWINLESRSTLEKLARRFTVKFIELQREEVLQELFAAGGEDGFGVELDAFEFRSAVADAHDDAVVGFGGDGEFAGERFAVDDERVVARGSEGVGEFAEDAFGVVMDGARFTVEEFGRANDFAAEGRADGLMAEADT